MRRITKISIDNYRAYYSPFDISLPKGEDLLIYGENGSGKSSLYKALKYFLESSVDPSIPFEVNQFSGRSDGQISVTYAEIGVDGNLLDGTEQIYTISTDGALTDNDQGFIKTSYRASGFLDYSKLLKVYLNNGERPNLFDLIIDLLGSYVPVGIDTRTIYELLASINKKLTKSYHRTDFIFKEGLNEYNKFSSLFPQLISQLNSRLKSMMSHHFISMGLDIELVDARSELYDPWRIKDIRVKGEVYLEVKHRGSALPGYNDRLNEARLSAIATCLYLSSLNLIARTGDTRVLFLDDVFIGLDLGNRLPVLEIIKKEFPDFQRIITTYDKSWYHQAKEALSDEGTWRSFEMYEGEVDYDGRKIVKPILVEPETSYGKACGFFSDKEHPDYPASANYLRKSFEKLLQLKIYDKAIRDENFEIIPAYRLTKLVGACKTFVSQIPDYLVPSAPVLSLLKDLSGLLKPLLHPLSHYVPDVPTYKSELNRAIQIYDDLSMQLKNVDYWSHCRVVREKGQKFEFVVKGVSGWENKYTLRLNDNLYLYDDHKGGRTLSLCEIQAVKIEGITVDGGIETQIIGPNDALAKVMVYRSLQDCQSKIIHYIKNSEKKTDIVAESLEEMFKFAKEDNSMQPLREVLLGVIF